MPVEVDTDQIRKAAHNNIPLAIKTYTMPHDIEMYIGQVLEKFLTEIGHEEIISAVSYCVKELAVNAKKANTKRVYFRDRNLDINDHDDYEEGMKTFKQDTLNNIDHYLKMQKDEELYIKVVFKTYTEKFIISVHNNVEITQKEQMRAFDRIARSRAFSSLEDAFSAVLDSSEGAGLGIVIMILMLKKVGLTEDAFELDVAGGETIAAIKIPFSEIHIEKINLLAERIVKEVDTLPQFPENLIHLQKLISDPGANIHDIAKQVSTDPSLTADLLKLVNSAMYMLPRKIDSIVGAVKLVGLRGLRNLLYTYGSQKILEKKYKEMKDLWKHSYKVAFYAHSLARTFRKKGDLLDDVYVSGILHDLGKIVANSLHPDLLDKIKKFCSEKRIAEKLLEGFSLGLNHAEIGALIAEKWNLPEHLIAPIKWHHEPVSCEAEHRELAYIVYLANCITYIEIDAMAFEQLDPTVMEYFDIKSDEQLRKILERLSKNFNKDNL